MNPVATYSFLPWLRQGLANTITVPDLDASVLARATTHVQLTLSGDPVAGGAELTANIDQDVALYGPGDVIGIDPRAVIRTDPANWITNFEGNYLPAIDFCDADFPWRYTPAAPDPTGLKLRPWITLIILAEGEFAEGQDVATRPSPYITVPDTSAFPPATELWAWAHVHVNDLLSADPAQLVAPDMTAVIPRLRTLLAASQDVAYSRLLCPRRLADNTGYHAFVVPTFETGRLAGLGLDPGGAPHATFSAWAGYPGQPQPPASRSTTGGSSAPARPGTSSTSSTCSSRSPPTPESAPATSTSPTPAPACRASPRPAWAACCGWAERCRYPTPTLTPNSWRSARRRRTGTSPTPTDSRKPSPRS